ncbi:hypothetical protein D9619_008424 [Psilocybe cf. subviscida]|uniref:Uncharacterized protein n=1 Tax=Psilocybe cf. subviscida TaxID=2480587 RepID=A0A8H5B9Y1_9AGAR|nr:hypothetical protein D9619_008424 [Psilocybe cf. subviscida]
MYLKSKKSCSGLGLGTAVLLSPRSSLSSTAPITTPGFSSSALIRIMEVALGAIALATAVKDLVELGQRIHESFAKVSNNLRKAQRVAKDIKEMVEKIEIFYKNHEDALDSMESFRVALLILLNKFKSFETSILPLLPKTGKRMLDLFVRGWWNNNKIEGRISDLQSEIVQLILKYTMDSAMRTEVRLEANHQETRKGLVDVHNEVAQGLQVLDVVQRNISAIAAVTRPHHSYKFSGTTSDELIHKIIMFAESTPSTSAPMLRTPNTITEETATTTYIKVQIDSIAMVVRKMLMLPASATINVASDTVTSLQLVPMLEQASMRITHLRRHVVRQVSTLCDILDTPSIHTISIEAGARALLELSVALERLGMEPESILVGTWAITLARLLFDASGGGRPDCGAQLAVGLLNQCRRYYLNGNKIQSLQVIEEAHTITQNLRNQYSGEAHFQLRGVQELHSNILLQYAELIDDQRSIEMTFEAVQILEDILNIHAFTQSTSHEGIIIKNVVQASSSFIDHLFSSAPPITAISSYAFALQIWGTLLFINGYLETALDLALLAIALHRKTLSINGHEHKVDLALALQSLVDGRIADCIPAEELVSIAAECIRLLRELVEQNPLFYARQLVNMLSKQASTLGTLNRDAEAIAAWEEAASLAGQILQDSKLCATVLSDLSSHFRHLKRHEDAVRTGTLAITTHREETDIQAGRYFYLSRDLRELRRFKESAEAAQASVTLYRHLAMRDPKRWMGDLTEGLSDLAHCLAALGNYVDALIAWKESVSMISNFFDTHPTASLDVIERYCEALYIHQNISHILNDKEECLNICSTTVQYLRRLLEIYPRTESITQSLFCAECCYAYSMLRIGYPLDAHHYIDSCLDGWSSTQEAISEARIARWHAAMINLKVDVLDAQGCTKQALLTTQNVHDLVKPFVSTFQPCFLEMIESMNRKARLQGNLSDSGEALQIAEGALQLVQDSKLEPIIDGLVWSLHTVAITALLHRDYNRAIEAAREGCHMLNCPEGVEFDEDYEHRSFIRPSLLSIMSSAEANLGRLSTALDYANRAVDMALEIGENKFYIPVTATAHHYMETRGYLAEILLATGDLAQARHICEERRAYFSKRVETRMGDYRKLAPIFRMLGILCCSEGLHEEGYIAAVELSRIMRMLGSVFPSLQEQVKIRLRRQAQVPILKTLEEISQRLDCGHQMEVASWFSI